MSFRSIPLTITRLSGEELIRIGRSPYINGFLLVLDDDEPLPPSPSREYPTPAQSANTSESESRDSFSFAPPHTPDTARAARASPKLTRILTKTKTSMKMSDSSEYGSDGEEKIIEPENEGSTPLVQPNIPKMVINRTASKGKPWQQMLLEKRTTKENDESHHQLKRKTCKDEERLEKQRKKMIALEQKAEEARRLREEKARIKSEKQEQKEREKQQKLEKRREMQDIEERMRQLRAMKRLAREEKKREKLRKMEEEVARLEKVHSILVNSDNPHIEIAETQNVQNDEISNPVTEGERYKSDSFDMSEFLKSK
ncbi:hypothetical protein QAD02_002212 [Eretmocerus hayati]|uniref:Uncharacterized protein n=1 Tax=Eretmocerus hayati TaxID=131215 RepID=A0ACC2NJG0_9HYME|nr:hypothetical protein QAD02_002212 [Eretmocerus hayati]